MATRTRTTSTRRRSSMCPLTCLHETKVLRCTARSRRDVLKPSAYRLGRDTRGNMLDRVHVRGEDVGDDEGGDEGPKGRAAATWEAVGWAPAARVASASLRRCRVLRPHGRRACCSRSSSSTRLRPPGRRDDQVTRHVRSPARARVRWSCALRPGSRLVLRASHGPLHEQLSQCTVLTLGGHGGAARGRAAACGGARAGGGAGGAGRARPPLAILHRRPCPGEQWVLRRPGRAAGPRARGQAHRRQGAFRKLKCLNRP